MADLSHWWGGDLSLTPSGDLATIDGIPKDNQRIFRRLCTNGSLSGAQLGEYLFHPTYGGSAPWYVGTTVDEALLGGVIRFQMYQEASVAHSPEPTIDINLNPNGTFLANIQYTDADSGVAVPPLVLNVTG
jgi:hypothetical protein